MALTEFPTIIINSGSSDTDSTASGAGPSTAITGTCAASVNTTTVTFNGAPDLSGVATDGSHVLLVSGANGGYNRISTVDDTAKTCVVETAMTVTASAVFAIGGKIPSINGTNARKLFATTTGPSTSFGASGRWVISFETDDTITSSIPFSATTGTGWIDIRSDTPGTLRTLTQSSSANHFAPSTATKWRFTDMKFANSHATPLEVFTFSTATAVVFMKGCVIGDSNGVNCPKGLAIRPSGSCALTMYDCSILRCTANGCVASINASFYNCEISRNGGNGIGLGGGTLIMNSCIVSYNSGDGILSSSAPVIINSTIHGNTGDGLEVNLANSVNCVITNSQITKNGGWGIKFSSTAPHYSSIEYNNFGNASDSTSNTSGSATGVTLSSTNTTVSPQYVDDSSSVRNFAVGTNCASTGMTPPTTTIGAGQSGTKTYVDQGVSQRQPSTPAFASM